VKQGFMVCGRGEPLAGLLVSEDRESRRVQAFVAVGVVEVPVGIDEREGSVLADGGDGLANPGNRGGEARIDQHVALGAGLQRHVAARALQQIDVVVEPGGLDGRFQRFGASLGRAESGIANGAALRLHPAGRHGRRACRHAQFEKASAIHSFEHCSGPPIPVRLAV
jgi:hypothetical protein